MSDIVLPDVVGRITAAIAKEIHTNQPVSNWASRIGHPCARYLVHTRLDWDKLPPITPEKKMMFDLGHVFEQHVAKVYLEKAGFQIVEMDRPIQSEASGLLKRVKIHGRMDFIVRDPSTGFEFPVEAKSASPNSWDKVNAIEDMLFSKHFWMRQYPGQLMMYLLSGKTPAEVGLFLLINKVTAAPKAIWLHQDYTYAEELIKKAEIVNAHVDAGTYPERIQYDDNICGKCDFADICLENVMRKEAEILTDPDFIDKLEERESFKAARARFEELDAELKATIKREHPTMDKGLAGDFMIVAKSQTRKNYERGPEIEPTQSTIISIKKLGSK